MEKTLEEYEMSAVEAYEMLIYKLKNRVDKLATTSEFIRQVLREFCTEYCGKGALISWKSYVHRCAANHNLDSEEQFIFEEHKIAITISHNYYKKIVELEAVLMEDPAGGKPRPYHIHNKREYFFYEMEGPMYGDTRYVNRDGEIL